MTALVERAPAKINLTLHITGRRTDGWHELESLVVFTRSGDTLALEPGPVLGLSVDGPTAVSAGPVADNLVCRVARSLAARVPGMRTGHFQLTKRLPVAAGIGGGSSDAAAALRLLGRLNGLAPADPRLLEAATENGADIPVCLGRTARMMSGTGEKLGPPLKLPPLPALVVNPGVPLETKPVFQKMGLAPGWRSTANAHPNVDVGSAEDLYGALKRGRNDMEDAACFLAPIVSDVLAVLAAAPGCRLARMSGSGATCFALFGNCKQAGRAKKAIQAAHPGWWVKSTILG